MFGSLFDVQMLFCVAGARDSARCRKWAKREGFCSVSKNDGRRGTFAEDLARCMSRGRRSTRDMFIRDVRSGRWFPERGCILEHHIYIVGSMRWFCVTGAALRMTSTFWQAQYFRQVEEWQNRKTHWYEAVSSAQLSMFERSLAELLLFWCCQLPKLKKSRRIASFLMLSSAKVEEVSQKCCVFDVVKFKNWGSLAE